VINSFEFKELKNKLISVVWITKVKIKKTNKRKSTTSNDMKNLFPIVLFTLLSFKVFSQESQKDYSEAFKLVEIWLEAQKDFENLPGISAIVINDQKVLWKGGFGLANPAMEIKAQSSTLYSICSISKLFTSVAIMKLYDEGKLRLDDRVSDLLPWFNLEQKYPESGPITVRSLLTHSSGLPRESAHPYWTGPDFPFPDTDEIKSKLGEQETLYPASTFFQYSNLGLTLLGEIIKEVSKQNYDEYIQQNILTPLSLNNTRTQLPENLYENELAVGYSALNRMREREKVKLFQAKGIKAAAGFSSNVEDLGKFASWQFRLLDTTITEILKSSTLRYMQHVHWTDPDWNTTWGLGFSVLKDTNGKTVVGHGGSCPGYRSVLSLYPKEKMAFSVMINASGTDPQKYVQGIKDIMAEVKVPDKNSTDKDLSEYIGFYNAKPWGSEIYFGILNDKLVSLSLPVDSPAKNLTTFKYVDRDIFQRIRKDDEPGEKIYFERDENGKITKFKQHGNYSIKIER
jgi:CubicO group peptidase (beta-lactamase class C family)